MTQIKNSNLSESDEINLLELLLRFISVLKRFSKLIGISIVVGLLAGVLIFFRISPYYKTRMIANSETLPNVEVINIVESWQDLIIKSDYITLSKELNLGIESAKKIQKLEAEDTGSQNATASSSVKNENSFVIKTEVTDVQILDTLQKAIIFSLENNDYVKKRAAIRRENFELLKKKITSEISALDSVKSAYSDLLKNNGTRSNSFIADPANVHSRIIELYERILVLETSIKLSEDIQVIEDFTKASMPDGPKLTPYLIVGGSFGLLIAVILIILISLNRKIKEINPVYSN